jgi:NAD-dependent dihydropyrimidine dehydrogenase PreA subunit
VVELPRPVKGEAARELADMCPMKVFDIEDLEGSEESVTAVVRRPRDCTMCRC